MGSARRDPSTHERALVVRLAAASTTMQLASVDKRTRDSNIP